MSKRCELFHFLKNAMLWISKTQVLDDNCDVGSFCKIALSSEREGRLWGGAIALCAA